MMRSKYTDGRGAAFEEADITIAVPSCICVLPRNVAGVAKCGRTSVPRKYDMLTQCWDIAVTASKTLGQQYPNTESTSCVTWETAIFLWRVK